MKENKFEFLYKVFESINDLNEKDAWLLREARSVTVHAYAPYSNFHVGAVGILVNGEIVAGTNQENASYPVGICAERSLLAAASSGFPGIAIQSIAISYKNVMNPQHSNRPVTPCGMCRQALLEYERRTSHPIRLILAGMEGNVIVIEKSSLLLPLGFNSEELL